MKKCTGAAHLTSLTGLVTKPGKSNQMPDLGFGLRCANQMPAPVHFFILELASFEELVLRRQEELCGPLQHCIIAIIVPVDHKNRLGATEQL